MTSSICSFSSEEAKAHSKSCVATTLKSGKKDAENGLLWAFVLLVESINIQAESAVIKSKALASNAEAQEKIDSEIAGVGWNYVPTAKKKQDRHTHWHSHKIVTANGGATVVYTKSYTYTSHIINGTQIEEANAANSQNDKIRQNLQTQLSILQQTSQVSESQINICVDASEQTTQEASSLLDMLKTLTNKILLHQ